MPKLLTTKEAADILRVTDQTIRRYVKSGELEGVKVKRQLLIPETAVEAFLKAPAKGSEAPE